MTTLIVAIGINVSEVIDVSLLEEAILNRANEIIHMINYFVIN